MSQSYTAPVLESHDSKPAFGNGWMSNKQHKVFFEDKTNICRYHWSLTILITSSISYAWLILDYIALESSTSIPTYINIIKSPFILQNRCTKEAVSQRPSQIYFKGLIPPVIQQRLITMQFSGPTFVLLVFTLPQRGWKKAEFMFEAQFSRKKLETH